MAGKVTHSWKLVIYRVSTLHILSESQAISPTGLFSFRDESQWQEIAFSMMLMYSDTSLSHLYSMSSRAWSWCSWIWSQMIWFRSSLRCLFERSCWSGCLVSLPQFSHLLSRINSSTSTLFMRSKLNYICKRMRTMSITWLKLNPCWLLLKYWL